MNMTTTQLLHGMPTQDLQAGDVVLCYGMRVRLDTLRTRHGGHYFSRDGVTEGKCSGGDVPELDDNACVVVYSWSGTVLNLAEVRAEDVVPMSWLRTEKWVSGWVTDRNDQWTVQGNFRATWTVERHGKARHDQTLRFRAHDIVFTPSGLRCEVIGYTSFATHTVALMQIGGQHDRRRFSEHESVLTLDGSSS